MNDNTRFSLMLDALTTLAEEGGKSPLEEVNAGLPTLNSILADNLPLPANALFLGMAEDGLPVLLDLYDPIPGPILVSADQGGGKTSFLQMVARAAEAMHDPADVQSGVITPHPDEWKGFRGSQSVAGIYSPDDETSRELLQSLVTWAHNNRDNKQAILLLIDGLETVTKLGEEAEQNLRWLLLRGPSRRVWPIIALNANRVRSMEAWLEFFRTRLFGCIQDEATAHFIAGDPGKVFNDLSGSQFTMREGNNWLNFWAPALD